jgi:Tol biopolymer transport system component
MPASDAPQGPLSGATIGRFRIDRLLGRGGMGEVYRAEDLELRRVVALKVLPEHLVGDADRLARFVQEARTASALNHPHVVSIYDIGTGTVAAGGRPVHFIAMELVAGETLRSVFDRRDTDLRHLLEYFAQAAEALAAAHAAGIVHRDLKPENVMVATGGYVKLLDFGLAKLKPLVTEADAQQPTVTGGTGAGIVLGTVGYMSPEQTLGRPVDLRSDIFSFGCIVYEAVTGVRAFAGTSTVDTLHRIIHADPAPLDQRAPGAPLELQRIVQKCLQKDPEERYQSMKDVAIDLRSLRRQLDSGSAPAVTTVPAARRAPVKTGVVVAAAVVVALAAAWLWRWTSTRQDGPAQQVSIQRVTDTGIVTDAVTSPDGKYLAFVESNAGKQGLYLRQMNGSRPIELVPPAAVGFWGIAFAPDGESIYYAVKSPAAASGGVYRIPVLGGAARLLLTDLESSVTFSPDGSQIAFYRIELSQGASSIVIANADGSGQHVLATKRPPEFYAPSFFTAASWSPDGKRIAACVRNSESRDARLITVHVATGTESAFPDRFGSATATAWMPDASGILFVAIPKGAVTSGNGGHIYLQPLPSGSPRRITSDVVEYRNVSVARDGRSAISVGYDAGGRLSAVPYEGGGERLFGGTRYDGGSGLTWAGSNDRVIFTRVVQTQTSLWSAAADGSDARQITTEGAAVWPAVSPDGHTVVFFGERGGEIGIWRSDDGASPRLITKIADASSIAFGPDRTIYFTSTAKGPPATYRLNVDGGEPALVAPLFQRAAISHDGTRLAGVFRENARAPLTLAVLDTKTGAPLKMFTDFNPASGSGSIAWTVDDKALLYTTAERTNIWRRNVESGREERLTNYSDLAVIRFALSPDGRTLVLFRGGMSRDAFLISPLQ